MARITDPNEEPDPDQFDFSDLSCPRCGCNSVEIITYPRGDAPRRTGSGWTGRWFGSTGRAKCLFCNIIFTITMDAADSEEQ